MNRTLKYASIAMAAGLGAIALVVGGSAVAGGADCAEGDAPAVYSIAIGDAESGDRGFLGVSVEEETEHPEGGARITNIVDDSAAQKAGLEEGDIIVGLDGKPVRGPGSLTAKLRETKPGDSVKVEILRDGRKQTLTVELGERARSFAVLAPPAWDSEEWQENMEKLGERFKVLKVLPKIEGGYFFGSPRPKLGVQLVETTPELRVFLGGNEDTGVLVGKVMSGMPAEAAGVHVGDLILAVDGQDIEGVGGLIEALAEKDGQTIRVEVLRDRQVKTIQVAIPALEDDDADGPRASLGDEPYREAQRAAAAAVRLAQEETRCATQEAARAYRDAVREVRRVSMDEVRRARGEARRALREARVLDPRSAV